MKLFVSTPTAHDLWNSFAMSMFLLFVGVPCADAEPQIAQITFSNSYGLKKGTPVFWKGEKVGVVRDVRRTTKANVGSAEPSRDGEVVVQISFDIVSNPQERFVAVVTGMGHGKTNTTLQIVLLPTSSDSSDRDSSNGDSTTDAQRIRGYGSFEELWNSSSITPVTKSG